MTKFSWPIAGALALVMIVTSPSARAQRDRLIEAHLAPTSFAPIAPAATVSIGTLDNTKINERLAKELHRQLRARLPAGASPGQ